MSKQEKLKKQRELVLEILEQLSNIMRYLNNAIYYGSKTSMISSYLIENLIHHDTEEQCEFEPCEIEDMFNSLKDAEIQLKLMHSTVDGISEILWDFSHSLDELMITTGIYYNKTDYVDEILQDYKNYYLEKDGDSNDE